MNLKLKYSEEIGKQADWINEEVPTALDLYAGM